METGIISRSKKIQSNEQERSLQQSFEATSCPSCGFPPEYRCDALERLLEPIRAEGLYAAPGRHHFSRQCEALTAIQACGWLGCRL